MIYLLLKIVFFQRRISFIKKDRYINWSFFFKYIYSIIKARFLTNAPTSKPDKWVWGQYSTIYTKTLHQWGLVKDQNCKLCRTEGIMAHILSGCKVALIRRKHRLRHDKILCELADVQAERKRKRSTDQKQGQIQFMRHG